MNPTHGVWLSHAWFHDCFTKFSEVGVVTCCHGGVINLVAIAGDHILIAGGNSRKGQRCNPSATPVTDLAYVWANHVLNNRMFKAHGADNFSDSPNKSVKGAEVDLKNMPAFGTLCTVHDHDSSAHALPSRTGVILGSSSLHSDNVHKVLMLDTHRIVHSMDVTFTPLEVQTDVTQALKLCTMQPMPSIWKTLFLIRPRTRCCLTIDLLWTPP